MAKKIVSFKTKGMNRDMSVSAFNPEFSFENRNLRLSTNEGNTMMSWVNEKGTLPIDLYTEGTNNTTVIPGYVIGTAILNQYLVIFTTGAVTDRIYRLKYRDEAKTEMDVKYLYGGYHLNFSAEHPIETLSSYESESVQKVYWTDGINQPRVINIMHTYTDGDKDNTYNPFDFVPELQLKEVVTVKKLLGANGSFAPGVIQYAFTYYNKYGQETNIFYTTPLYYISYRERGASPEETRVENAFKISVRGLDYEHFEYLRIYSIQRTSINDTPIVKRIQDVSLEKITSINQNITYIDTGTTGESVDPTEMLYKGGEQISAKTIAQKDNTLFLGNIEITRPFIEDTVTAEISSSTRTIYPTVISYSTNNYGYSNQLTSLDSAKVNTVPCGGFKTGNIYRFGLQFQYKNGKWSNPIWIKDDSTSNNPTANDTSVTLSIFKGQIDYATAKKVYDLGYRRVRGLVVFPSVQDRVVLCQGVLCPTLSTGSATDSIKTVNEQASWFFRTYKSSQSLWNSNTGAVRPSGKGTLPYTSRNVSSTPYNPNATNVNIRQVEIQGEFNPDDKFYMNYNTVTMHSPDIEFDDYLKVCDFTGTSYDWVGQIKIDRTYSDIDIQTESPTISSNGSGFIHKSFKENGMLGIVSGLFYDDYLVDDYSSNNEIRKNDTERSSMKWMVYLWNKNGSLNNDINRPSDKGTQSAKLKKKIISNLRYGGIPVWGKGSSGQFYDTYIPQLFNSDESTILKVGSDIYMGNIDTLLNPYKTDGMYMAFSGNNVEAEGVSTPFKQPISWKTFSTSDTEGQNQGLWNWNGTTWSRVGGHEDMGNQYTDLAVKKDSVRMKYKSSAHLVCSQMSLNWSSNINDDSLPILEITRIPSTSDYTSSSYTLFGGSSDDALKENTWIPCGEPVSLTNVDGSIPSGGVTFYYSYGDTYFQRWDCLKTYPYTKEDVNQVVEIGSFMLETYVNVDGRYDRNRGQLSNLNMSPTNFNLINPIYSQIDNFFSYKILDNDDYKNLNYPNQLTWSKTKTSGADVDLWTNVTLASVLELDGDKGKLNKLVRFNDQLLAFQDTGISQILYNENTQISTTEGVPIEIANSGKVQGKRYLSNTIGSSNKWSLAVTPLGIYFMDNKAKDIYLFNGQLSCISQTGGFNSWCKQNIPSSDNPTSENTWKPYDGFRNFVSYYDMLNQEVLFINDDEALAYSERFSAFTSFYDYGSIPYFCNLSDTGVWLRSTITGKVTIGSSDNKVPTVELSKHQAGKYCNFFGTQKPYWMTLIGNPEPQTSKVFTNLEFRATVDGDGTFEDSKFTPYLPFDYLETWDEYQHGYASLANLRDNALMQHHMGDESSLKRKFRIWRCDIPRDNALADKDRKEGTTYNYSTDALLNISRTKAKPLDRMRNPWLYLKLQKNASESMGKTEIHDIVMTYFS